MVAKVLGIALSSGYELMHEADFPVLKVGSRMVVPKEKFIQWVDQHTKGSDEYLPRILSEVLSSKLDTLGSRIGRLLFKLAVEQDLPANILASMGEINLDAVEHARSQCVQQVKKINGEIKFEDTLRAQQRLD